jgi:hypothetical protein
MVAVAVTVTVAEAVSVAVTESALRVAMPGAGRASRCASRYRLPLLAVAVADAGS